MASVIFCKPCGEKRVKDVKERLQVLLTSSSTNYKCCFICDAELTLDRCKSTDNHLDSVDTSSNQPTCISKDTDDFAVRLEIKTEVLDSSDIPDVSALKSTSRTSTKLTSYVEDSESEDEQIENMESSSDESYAPDSDGDEKDRNGQKSPDGVSLHHIKVGALQPEFARMIEIVDNSEKPYKCMQCSKRVCEIRYILPHLCAHLGKYSQNLKYYQCNDCCDKKFKYFSEWSEHTRQFVCTYPSCGAIKKSKESLKQHEEKHEETKLIKCKICGDQFSSNYKLTVHKEKTHLGEDEKGEMYADVIEDTAIKISSLAPDLRKLVLDESFPGIGFKCKFCDKSIATNIGYFLAHVAEHLHDKSVLDKPYQCCECCDRQFAKFVDWKIHVKPYRCKVAGCEHRVERKSQLKKHTTHKGKMTTCPECLKVFKTRYHLIRHMKSSHAGTSTDNLDVSTNQSVVSKDDYVTVNLKKPVITCKHEEVVLSSGGPNDQDRTSEHQDHRSTKVTTEDSKEEETSDSEDDQTENTGESSDKTYIEGSDSDVNQDMEGKKKVQKGQSQRKTTLPDGVSLPQFKISALQPELARMIAIVDDPEKPYQCKECSQQTRGLEYILRHVCAHIGKFNQQVKCYQCNICCDKQFNTFMAWCEHTRQFVCEYPSCGAIKKSKSLLKRHKETHKNVEESKVIECKICGDQFPSREKFTHHKTHAHIGVQLNTDIGKDGKTDKRNANAIEDREIKISSLVPDLRKLVLDESFPGIGFKCKFCEKSIATNIGHFLAHAAEHLDDKSLLDNPYQCQVCCDRTFDRFTDWLCHVKPYRCEVAGCEQRVERRCRLKRHMMRQHTVKSIPCPKCPEVFNTRYNRNIHMETMHTKDHTCSVCGKQYHTKDAWMAHEARHKHDKQFTCSHCGKMFTNIGLLKLHEMDHTGQRPFQCDKCGSCFKTKRHLEEHMYIHSDSKPYKCEFCGKQMSSLSWYKRHRQIHTGVGNLKCRHCDERFKYSVTRAQHERTHPEWTGVEYVCDLCGKVFVTKSKLKRHSKTHMPK